MAVFSVLVVTAPPPGQSAEASGAIVKVDGRECLLRSVELFLNRENVKQVQIGFDSAEQEEVKRKFGNHLGFSGVKVLWTSMKWSDQLAAAADKLDLEATHVIVHDGARPCVPYTDIDALMEAAEKHDAIVLTTPLRASLIEKDEGGSAVTTHLASQYVQMLTPQVFSKAKFLEMAQARRPIHASQMTLLPGSGLNIRVGSAADAGLAKAMLGMLPKPKAKGLNNPFEEAQW